MAGYLVIYAGGTIGMKPSKKGLTIDKQAITDILGIYAKKINIELYICDPLLDSSAIKLENWHELIELIRENEQKYDGFLLIHGTDTLAYTASVLSFFLQNIKKPIVLTGAQYPLSSKQSDGFANLKHAFYVLTQTPINETVIVFGHTVFRGTSATKIDTVSVNAFEAPYEKMLGLFRDDEFALNKKLFKEPVDFGVSNTEKKLNTKLNIMTYILTPGVSSDLIAKSLIRDNLDSAILLSYGNGNIPDDPNLIDAVSLFTQQGKLLINKSQVLKGVADDKYAQSHALYQAGALPAGKMTLEMTLAKLLYVLS